MQNAVRQKKIVEEKLRIKALKLISYVLNCILEPPNLGVRGAVSPGPPLDPLGAIL